jgi:hypothetical protein
MNATKQFPGTIAAVVDRCASEGATTHEAMVACSEALVEAAGEQVSGDRIGLYIGQSFGLYAQVEPRQLTAKRAAKIKDTAGTATAIAVINPPERGHYS